MRPFVLSPVVLVTVLLLGTAVAGSQSQAGKQTGPALLQDYFAFTVTAPPPALELDPFYRKYVDAHGIPVVTSAKVPDAALLMARDIVQFMLANRPDLRRELIRKRWKVAIMAQGEVTYDIPEHRKYRLLPKIDDERLTPEQRENYHKPGGVGTMTGEQVPGTGAAAASAASRTARTPRRAPRRTCSATRARATSAAPSASTSSRTGSCGGRSTPSTPTTARRWRRRTRRRKSRACPRRRGIPATTSTSTWATGIEAYVFGSGRGPESLLEADPRLYELVRQVIPATKMPGNVYVGRVRQPPPM